MCRGSCSIPLQDLNLSIVEFGSCIVDFVELGTFYQNSHLVLVVHTVKVNQLHKYIFKKNLTKIILCARIHWTDFMQSNYPFEWLAMEVGAPSS